MPTLSLPTPTQRLVHIHLDADEIGRVYIAASPKTVVSALAGRELGREGDGTWRRICETSTSATPSRRRTTSRSTWAAMAAVRHILPGDRGITLGAGNHTGWPQRFLRYGRAGRQIGTTCGSMGHAVPAAVAISLRAPALQAIAFVGEGGFTMSGNEIATAAQHGGRPIVLVFNNGTYGTIRMHQDREHRGRISGTDLGNSDFSALATGLGAAFEYVSETAQFRPALECSFANDRPTLIELITDPNRISIRTTVKKLRSARR